MRLPNQAVGAWRHGGRHSSTLHPRAPTPDALCVPSVQGSLHISIAMCFGSLRGRRKRPPAAAARDRLTSGTPNRELFDATTKSQASTISQPPASAAPSTAAMIGLVRLYLCVCAWQRECWQLLHVRSTLFRARRT